MVALPRARNSMAQRALHRSLTSAQWWETWLRVYQGCQYHSGSSSDMGVHTMVTSFPKYLASSLNRWWIIVASGSWSSAVVMSDALAKVITTDTSGNVLLNTRHPCMFSMPSWRTSRRRGLWKVTLTLLEPNEYKISVAAGHWVSDDDCDDARLARTSEGDVTDAIWKLSLRDATIKHTYLCFQVQCRPTRPRATIHLQCQHSGAPRQSMICHPLSQRYLKSAATRGAVKLVNTLVI